MATLREIKQRISGVKSTQKITKAMKMVAASRLRRAQENITKARPYAIKISDVLSELVPSTSDMQIPLFKKVENAEKIAIIGITADRGLCGSFNVNIIKSIENEIRGKYSIQNTEGNVSLFLIGKKGFEYFNRRNYKIDEKHLGIFSDLKFEFAERFITNLSNRFINGEFDKIILISNEFKSVMQQNLVVKQILPITSVSTESTKTEITDYIYEPEKQKILQTLIPSYLNSQIWKALLESYASELGARMTAMDQATENASEMINGLQLKYNKARQAAITTEIIEIVSGANALS